MSKLLFLYGSVFLFLSVSCVNHNIIHSTFSRSLRSLRPNLVEPVLHKGCGLVIQEPYGIIKNTFVSGEMETDTSCIWRFQAPRNHIIHIYTMEFDLDDQTTNELDDVIHYSKISYLSIYDSSHFGGNPLTGFGIYPFGLSLIKDFKYSKSSSNSMILDFKYRDNPEFKTQKVVIHYEFLDADAVNRILN